MKNTPESYITRYELAGELRVKAQTLAAWACRGEGPTYVRVGRAVRYRRADVEVWLAARTVNLAESGVAAV